MRVTITQPGQKPVVIDGTEIGGIKPEELVEVQELSADDLIKSTERESELTIMGPKSKKLVAEIKKLEVARIKQESEAERLAQELANRADTLNVLRATSLLEEIDHDEIVTSERALVGLQEELGQIRGSIVGIDRLLSERREVLVATQLEDANNAVNKSSIALGKTCKAFLKILTAGARAMQKAGLLKEWTRWCDLIRERQRLLEQLYDLVPGSSDNRADRQVRLELMETYGLFSDDVPEIILDLAECILDLYKIEDGWPIVRGRKRQY